MPEQPPKNVCANCIWFLQFPVTHPALAAPIGACHGVGPAKQVNRRAGAYHVDAAWPVVEATNWCKEFNYKEEA